MIEISVKGPYFHPDWILAESRLGDTEVVYTLAQDDMMKQCRELVSFCIDVIGHYKGNKKVVNKLMHRAMEELEALNESCN